MTARDAVTRAITGIPNLLGRTVTPRFIRDPPAYVHVSSVEEVADTIGVLLPALLASEGYVLVELPNIEPDGFGGWSVRVPLSEQPWADAEIFIDHTGRVVLGGVPATLPLVDGPTLAAALLAVHTAVELHRHRRRY